MGKGDDLKGQEPDKGKVADVSGSRKEADDVLYRDLGMADSQRADRLSDMFAGQGGLSKGWSGKGWSGKGWSGKGWSADDPTELSFGAARASDSGLLKRMPTLEDLDTLKKIGAVFNNVDAAKHLPDAGKGTTPSKSEAIAPMKAWEIPGEIGKIFNKVDVNGDGKLDLNELGRAVQDTAYTGKAAQALAALYSSRGALAGSGDAISKESLSKLSDLKDLSDLLPTFDTVGKIGKLLLDSKLFPYKADGVTKETLLQRSQDKDLPPAEKILLTQAVNSFDDLKRLSGSNSDGLTSDGVRRLRDLASEYPDVALTKKLELITNSVSDAQKFDTSQLFSDSGWFGWFKTPAIVPEAIQQGTVEDCNLMAPMASLAKFDSAKLRNMITDAGNGEFKVTFPGVPDEPITVKAPSQAELGLYSQATEHGIWPAVIEKAFGEYVRRHPDTVGLTVPPCTAGAPAAECLSQGGYWEVVNILTGKEAQVIDLRNKLDSGFAQQLKDSLDRNAVITIASKDLLLREPGDVIQNLHDYSVLGFDPNGPGGGTLILRDPYGKRSPTGENTINVRADRLRADFDWIAVEGKDK